MLGERERADTLAGSGEEGVADCRENRRKRGLAETGGRVISFEEVDFDFRRSLVDADGLVFVEVRLDCAPLVDRDFVGHDGAESFEDGALALVFRRAEIDDLAADVTRKPDFIDLDLFLRVDRQLNDAGEMATMGELESDAHCGSGRKFARPPTGFFSGEFDDTGHADPVNFGSIGLVLRVDYARTSKQFEAKLDGVLPCGVCEFIEKGLEHPTECVTTGCAECVDGDAKRHQ